MKGHGWYSFPPPKPGDRAARVVHFPSVFYIRLLDYFRDLEDPRLERCKRHSLLDIITIAICAVICGADTWVHVAMFGKSKEEWFQTFLELPNGIPSHDTFGTYFPGWIQSGFRSAL